MLFENNRKPTDLNKPFDQGRIDVPLKELKKLVVDLPNLGDELDAFSSDLMEIWRDQPKLP